MRYGLYLELGGTQENPLRARPFLRPPLYNNKKAIEDILYGKKG